MLRLAAVQWFTTSYTKMRLITPSDATPRDLMLTCESSCRTTQLACMTYLLPGRPPSPVKGLGQHGSADLPAIGAEDTVLAPFLARLAASWASLAA